MNAAQPGGGKAGQGSFIAAQGGFPYRVFPAAYILMNKLI
jgi:hypothetical protein